MKMHSKIYKVLTVLVTVVISVMGARTDVFAASTSLKCGYALCSKNLIMDGPYMKGSSLSSSIPVYGGMKLTDIDSVFDNDKYHYSVLYCSEFGTGTLKKRHTFSIARSTHIYKTPTDEYKPVHEGEYIVGKALLSSGLAGNFYDYNPETGKYDILTEYIEKDNENYWHYRKYICNHGQLSGVFNKSSGNEVSFDNAKSVTDNHGCGQGDYFVEVHEKRLIEHGHTESEGILYYLKDDGTYTRVKKSQLVYDDTVKAYALPGIEYYISSFPVEDDSYKAKVVMAKDATGESTRFITYYPRRQLCVSETRCDLCGWNTTSYNIYDSTTTATAVDSSTHHILVKCSHCGYKYEEYDTDHNFSYGEYTPVILSSGKSTQHSVTRTCIAKLNSPSCGYSDTIKEDHTWEYSDCTSVDGKTHKTVRTCTKCGYSEEASENHSLVYGDWTDNGEVSHIRNVSCDTCGYESTEMQNHNFITQYEQYSSTHHKVTETCDCGHINIFYEEHKDNDHDNCCDECGYISSIFSVTVPATMYLVMAKDGSVYSADNAEIVNNSTGAVSVKEISIEGQNNWRVVPYTTDMANQKVDSKLIGFSIRDQQTTEVGKSAVFYPGDDWNIGEGKSFPLPYNAIVSATSNPIENKQVLNITFVVDWSDS